MNIKLQKDTVYLGLIFVLFCIFSIFLGKIYGSLFMDCGREVYLPQLVLEGKVLFKEVFGMYNPLSYQINALLYLIFGKSVGILYFTSYLNALLFLFGIYFISRNFINEFYSFVLCLTIMSYFVFGSTNVISYIFPYSFGIVYAATAVVYSVLFFLKYMKSDDKKFLYISSLAAGIAFANKPEYGVCYFPILVALCFRKENLKTILISILYSVIPVIFSYGILFLQGFNFRDLLNYLNFIHRFLNTDEQIYYTLLLVSVPWDLEQVQRIIVDFAYLAVYIVFGCAYVSLLKRNFYLKIFGLLLIPAFYSVTKEFIRINNNDNIFSWIIIACFIILYFKTEKIETLKDKMLIFVICVGILSAWRINFLPVSKFSYSIYSLLPLLAVFAVYFDENIKIKINYRLYTSVVLIFFSLVNVYYIHSKYQYKYLEADTSNGKFITEKYYTQVFENITSWVNNNTKPNESVLVLPEGLMVNFVTGRPTKPMYYHLIPNHISALGEGNIVKGLDSDKPDYIIINNMYYGMYGKTYMCTDFGLEICKFVEQNYDYVTKYYYKIAADENFEAKIYKLIK